MLVRLVNKWPSPPHGNVTAKCNAKKEDLLGNLIEVGSPEPKDDSWSCNGPIYPVIDLRIHGEQAYVCIHCIEFESNSLLYEETKELQIKLIYELRNKLSRNQEV